MKRYTRETIPDDAFYLGSTEGPDQMSEQLADRIEDATAPAYVRDDSDGTRHFYDLCPLN